MPDTPHAARTIQEVLDRLDAQIDLAVRNASRTAYFACLYRAVTARVQEGIRAGRFQDGPRMEKLDVVFANRYLAALEAYQRGQPTTRSWKAAFQAAELKRLVILQHLLLGMNAHIKLDLGIAAASVAPGSSLAALKRDFDEISVVLGEMLEDVQRRINGVSPWMGLLDRVGARSDEEIFTFGLRGSRDLAWHWAQRFSRVHASSLPAEIDRLDWAVSLPTPMVATALAVIRARETSDVARVVTALR
jgi:hypothetical protein